MRRLFRTFPALAVIAALLVVPATPAQAAVIAGPVTNPANGHLYYLLDVATWTAAETEAVALGGHLATINDQAEQDWVVSEIFPLVPGANPVLWIGLNDAAAEGVFVWSSGQPLDYTNWTTGAPNSLPAGVLQDYVHMILPWEVNQSGKWDDVPNSGFANPDYGLVEVAVSCNGLPATLTGTNGDDTLVGTAGNDVIVGLAGDDRITGGGGNDTICAGDGTDWVLYDTAPAAVQVDLRAGTAKGGAGFDTLFDAENVWGSAFDDKLFGNNLGNHLVGGPGDDRMFGRGGDDRLDGKEGNDKLAGLRGNDHLDGGDGDDVLKGGAGDDFIAGIDGTDRVSYFKAPSPMTVNLLTASATGEGNDTIYGVEDVVGSRYADSITGDGKPNRFWGGTGDDQLFGRAGDDRLRGQGGVDSGDGGNGTDFCRTEIRAETCEL